MSRLRSLVDSQVKIANILFDIIIMFADVAARDKDDGVITVKIIFIKVGMKKKIIQEVHEKRSTTPEPEPVYLL